MIQWMVTYMIVVVRTMGADHPRSGLAKTRAMVFCLTLVAVINQTAHPLWPGRLSVYLCQGLPRLIEAVIPSLTQPSEADHLYHSRPRMHHNLWFIKNEKNRCFFFFWRACTKCLDSNGGPSNSHTLTTPNTLISVSDDIPGGLGCIHNPPERWPNLSCVLSGENSFEKKSRTKLSTESGEATLKVRQEAFFQVHFDFQYLFDENQVLIKNAKREDQSLFADLFHFRYDLLD